MLKNRQDFSFCYFVCSVGNEALLKNEVAYRFPLWKLSFSGPGLITYKVHPRPLSYEELSEISITYALSFGGALGKIEKTPPIDSYEKGIEYLSSKGNYLKGVRAPQSSSFDSLPSSEDKQDNDKDKKVPSRAYHKIAQAFQLYGKLPQKGDLALDLGSAPGGAALYFLSHEVGVDGIDPGEIHPHVLSNPLYKHHRCSLHEYRIPLYKKYTWIACDINLDPFGIVKDLNRLFHFISKTKLKAFFFTVKHTKGFKPFPHGIDDLCHQIRLLYKENNIPLKEIVCRQVPSNKNEFLMMIISND